MDYKEIFAEAGVTEEEIDAYEKALKSYCTISMSGSEGTAFLIAMTYLVESGISSLIPAEIQDDLVSFINKVDAGLNEITPEKVYSVNEKVFSSTF